MKNLPIGEFYITLEDFLRNKMELDMVHVVLNNFQTHESNFKTKWSEKVYHGAWVEGQNAGGYLYLNLF